MQNKIKQIAVSGIFLAVATLLSYVEALLPLPIPLPAVRLGLANVAIVMLIYLYPARYAAAVAVLKCLLVFLLRGNPTALMLSASGSLLALAVMLLLKKTDLFSIIGVSVAGAASHVSAQVITSCLLIGSTAAFYYLPYLLLISLITGSVSGFISSVCVKRFDKVTNIKAQ